MGWWGEEATYARECPEGDSISRVAEPYLAASTVNVSDEIFVLRDWQLHARFRMASSEARLWADCWREREIERANMRETGGLEKITSREDSRLVLRAIRYGRGPIISHCESLTRGIKTSVRTICDAFTD